MSKWLTHVKKTMKSEAGKKSSMGKKWFTHVLKTAKKTYHKKGGAEDSASDEETPKMGDVAVPAAAGRRRARKGGKTVRRGLK